MSTPATDQPFDQELMDRIAALQKGAAEVNDVPAAEDKGPKPPVREPKAGEKLFSSVFWKPKAVPDFPVPVFSREDWHETVRAHIPTKSEFWVWPKEETELFAFAMFSEDRTLLYGPTGTGKSALPKAYCAELCIPYMLTSCHGQQEATDFLGKDNIKFDETTQSLSAHVEFSMLTQAAKFGGMIILDEAFRSPILMAIQSLLEPGGSLVLPDAAGLNVEDRRITPPAGKSWVVLTDNTNGQGSDDGKYNAEVQDLSTLDRITATIFIGYPSKNDENRVLTKAAPGLDKDKLAKIVQLNGQIRNAFGKGAIQQPLSIRAAIQIAKKAQHIGVERAYELSYKAKLSPVDQGTYTEAWRQVFGA
jgi:MoxR-like ATPase